MTNETGRIVGLDPTPLRLEPGGARHRARRMASLDGAVVGLISNGKGQATLFLESLYSSMREIANLADTVLIQKESVFAVPSEQDWSLITSRATVGVTAFGG